MGGGLTRIRDPEEPAAMGVGNHPVGPSEAKELPVSAAGLTVRLPMESSFLQRGGGGRCLQTGPGPQPTRDL
jgi:hypothetical protein